jgi:MYXO-CTERM domain-containing protein
MVTADPPHDHSRDFSAQGLPSMDKVWSWHEKLAAMGTRYTGSPGHVRFTDWLQEQFSVVPGFDLYTDRFTFNRWLAQDWSLSIHQPNSVGPSGPVPVSYYYPYSGTTGPGGISGRLVDLDHYEPIWYTPAFWARAKGEIALVRVPLCSSSLDIGQAPIGGFEHDKKDSLQTALHYVKYASLLTHPVFQGIFAAVPLLDARRAGVRGVICVWTGMSDDLVANQYNPFTTPYPNKQGQPVPGDPGCPALWVGDDTGLSLSHSAGSGQATVTLTLTASITPDAATETVWGVLRGSGADQERGLIVNTHTDGPSVPEENGALGLLALAQYFARRQRRRDLYFVMVTGHFRLLKFMKTIPTERFVVGNDATSLWMTQYPEIYQNALAGLTMEHLGCTMWTDKDGQYVPTGEYEWSATYTTQKEGSLNATNLAEKTYLDAVRATNRLGATARPVVTTLPIPLFFGEGAPLYAGGLGTVSLCPLPSYLLQAGSRTQPQLLNLDKLDKRLIYGQIVSFARTISALDAAPATNF